MTAKKDRALKYNWIFNTLRSRSSKVGGKEERGRHEVSRGSPDTDLEHKEGNLL